MPVFKTSRRSSGTPAFVSSWGPEIIELASEVLGRTARSFASGVFASSVWKQKVKNRQAGRGSEGTHLDGATNSIEIQLPGRDRFIVVLCTGGSGEDTPFTFLDDIPLNLNCGAAIVIQMNKQAGE